MRIFATARLFYFLFQNKRMVALQFFVIAFSTLVFCQSAMARVFLIKESSFSAYLKGSYTPTATKNTLLSDSSGTSVTLDSEFKTNMSGEFGFIYGGETLNFRFGIEVVSPANIKDVKGSDAAGNELYSVNSEVSVVVPKVGIEFTFKRWNTARMILYAGAGSTSLVGRNSYVFTTAGTTQFGLADYYEDLRASSTMYEGSMGFEGLLADTTTYLFEAGYRSMSFTSVKHNRDVSTLTGTVVKGDAAKNMDTSARTLDLSGYYLSLSFRFWIF